ncbi:MAG TPA: asparaginase domain-containing protein [Membranihabitans sp.]|nr:asparaginase domain-containing protein [Membranihabitans sp.]
MIHIFTTGGTFDKEYNYISGDLTFMDTHIPEMLKRARCGLDVRVEKLMMIDSLEMTDQHRSLIATKCHQSVTDKIVITHGTDTLVETATFLAQKLSPFSKTIVITGAMVPYSLGASSDGFFNIGSALSFVQVLSPGIYVAMNGRKFVWNNVQKNYNTGFFERIHQASE